jgi:hypothetical protein
MSQNSRYRQPLGQFLCGGPALRQLGGGGAVLPQALQPTLLADRQFHRQLAMELASWAPTRFFVVSPYIPMRKLTATRPPTRILSISPYFPMRKLTATWPATSMLNSTDSLQQKGALQRIPDWGVKSHFVALKCKCCNPFALFLKNDCVANGGVAHLHSNLLCKAQRMFHWQSLLATESERNSQVAELVEALQADRWKWDGGSGSVLPRKLNCLAAIGLLGYPVRRSWWEDSGVYGCEIRGPVGRSGFCGSTGQDGDSANSAGG